MRKASFWRELWAALVLTIIASSMIVVLRPLVGADAGLKMVMLGLAALYLIHLLRQVGVNSGRIVHLLVWLTLSAALLLFNPPVLLWLVVQATVIWVLRSIYFHHNLGSKSLDMMLNILAIIAAISTALHTQSLWLTVWTFFLVQSIHVLIAREKGKILKTADHSSTAFQHSYTQADKALRALANQQR